MSLMAHVPYIRFTADFSPDANAVPECSFEDWRRVKVNPGDSCNSLAFLNGPIATEDFVLWNRGTGGTAYGALQANTYACVALELRASQANAVPTPQPAHPGISSSGSTPATRATGSPS